MDFDTAYLNSTLDEDIYIKCPPRFTQPGKVLKINKALYGIKQSGRRWFGTLHDELLEMGFRQMHFDPCVFRLKNLTIAVYVDDMLLIGPMDKINGYKSEIQKSFSCKDLGQAKYLLGLEINSTESHISIGQSAYAQRILNRYGMADCNARKTPLDSGTYPLRNEDLEEPTRTQLYQQRVGSIGYLVIGTRPDLAFSVAMLGTFNANPSEEHLNLAKQVLRHVKGTLEHKIIYLKETSDISTRMFADASYATDPNSYKSISGYLLQLGNLGTISWASKKQECVAKSTCKAEYMACSYATSHLIWSKSALKELECKISSTQLLTDSEGARCIILDHRINARSTHIAVHFHYTRERFHAGDFTIIHVPTKDNLADGCTKALARPILDFLTRQMLVWETEAKKGNTVC